MSDTISEIYTSLRLSNQRTIRISTEPIGQGGEGNVYVVDSPAEWQGHVIKIYHPKERKTERASKLNYMIANPPKVADGYSVIWPIDIVYRGDEFMGYLMKQAPGLYDLTVLSSLKLSIKLSPEWQEKYTRANTSGLINRLKICYNLAYSVNILHQTQKYVLVDMKPENIRVSLNGQISLIDIDSIEITEDNKLLFPAEKLTSEYSPAEMQDYNHHQDLISETWDRFSMAVIFYKILLGLHPFTGTGKDTYSQLVSYTEKIRAGLFPFGSKADYFSVIPKPHDNFWALPISLQELFKGCFDEGNSMPELRPTAQDWKQAMIDTYIIEEKYQNPIQQPARRVEIQIESGIYKMEKMVLSNHYSTGSVVAINLVNLINIFDLDVTLATIGYTALIGGASIGFLAGIKYTEQVEFNHQEKELVIHYKGLFQKNIRKRYKLEKIQTTFGFEGKKKRVLRIYLKTSFNRREVAKFVIDQKNTNEKVIKEIVKQIRLSGISMSRPGTMP
jgi:serine/threonine protein kinase